MPETAVTHPLSLHTLAHHCQHQTQRYWNQLPSDSHYCHAIFCRALTDPQAESSKQAWGFIHHAYQRQVTIWVKRHRLFVHTGDEPETLAQMALQKMWLAFANEPDKLQRFPAEPEPCLKKLLRYLQMCVDSVVKDRLAGPPEVPLPDELVADKLETASFDAVWGCLDQRLHDEKERLVVDAAFVDGLKPSQIYMLYAQHFQSVQEIYRIKEIVLARFRRDESLRDCLENAGR
jgi:hypothetical protein